MNICDASSKKHIVDKNSDGSAIDGKVLQSHMHQMQSLSTADYACSFLQQPQALGVEIFFINVQTNVLVKIVKIFFEGFCFQGSVATCKNERETVLVVFQNTY